MQSVHHKPLTHRYQDMTIKSQYIRCDLWLHPIPLAKWLAWTAWWTLDGNRSHMPFKTSCFCSGTSTRHNSRLKVDSCLDKTVCQCWCTMRTVQYITHRQMQGSHTVHKRHFWGCLKRRPQTLEKLWEMSFSLFNHWLWASMNTNRSHKHSAYSGYYHDLGLKVWCVWSGSQSMIL